MLHQSKSFVKLFIAFPPSFLLHCCVFLQESRHLHMMAVDAAV